MECPSIRGRKIKSLKRKQRVRKQIRNSGRKAAGTYEKGYALLRDIKLKLSMVRIPTLSFELWVVNSTRCWKV